MPGDASKHRRNAVVVGDSPGLGGAIAEVLTRKGFQVFLGAISEDREHRTAANFVGSTANVDVTSEESVRTFVDAIPEASALVIANGPRRSKSRRDAETDDWHWRWENNVLGVVRLTKRLLPLLRISPDAVIVIVSPDERSREEELALTGAMPHTGTRTLHRLIEQEISGTAVRLSKVRHGWPADAACIAQSSISGIRAVDIYPYHSSAVTEEIGEVVGFVVTGPTSLLLEEVSIRPSPSRLHDR